MILAPSEPSRFAIPCPMTELAPVTIATFPCNRCISSPDDGFIAISHRLDARNVKVLLRQLSREVPVRDIDALIAVGCEIYSCERQTKELFVPCPYRQRQKSGT